MRMREIGLISQSSKVTSRIDGNPVVVDIGRTDRVPAVVTEPVIHAITSPGTMLNHLPCTLPEIKAPGNTALSACTYMTIYHIMIDRAVESKQHYSNHYNCYQTTNQHESAVANGKRNNEQGRNRNSYPCP